MKLHGQAPDRADGYAMAALLVAIAVMSIMLSVAMPAWRTMVQREKEEELIFRGMQYARAIGLFQRKYAAAYPPDADTLVKGKYLRKKYKDPMVPDGEFQVLYQVNITPGGIRPGTGSSGGRSGVGQQQQPSMSSFGPQAGVGGPGGRGGMLGVVSKSTATSLRVWNGRNHYNEWQFLYLPNMMQPGMGGPGRGGQGGRGGRGGMGPGGMGPGGMGPGGTRGGQGGGRGPGRQFSPGDSFRGFGEGPGGRGPGG